MTYLFPTGLSHVGKVRMRNEDTILIDPNGRFAVLADGMGGHLGGQIASEMCVEELNKSLSDEYEDLAKNANSDAKLDALKNAILRTSSAVSNRAQNDPACHQMGTTVVVWLKFNMEIFLAYAGDSRAYLLRNNKFFQMTFDHSFQNEQIKRGIPSAIARHSPMKNMLVRNVGLYPPTDPTCHIIPSQNGDVWLICSDGLSNKLNQQEIHDVLTTHKPHWDQACAALIDLANARGGEDNISVIILPV